MPVLIALLSVVSAVAFFIIRSRNTLNAARDLVGMADDVRLAARRFGFRRKSNVHPVDAVEEDTVLLGALSVGYSMLGQVFTEASKTQLVELCQDQLLQTHQEAQDLVVYGHWMIQQCGTPSAGFTRVLKRLYRLRGNAAFDPIMGMLSGLSKGGDLTPQQREALEEVQTVFRLR